ncbi:MAG: hypothetical protein HN344_01055 [Gammaproteobacteria bacterium]|nr:hypothetical protein [Gammaproteobacteria bacterium]
MATWLLTQALEKVDLPPQQLTILSLNSDHIEMGPITLGQGGLQLERLRIDYDWKQLLTGTVRRITVNTPKVQLQTQSGRLTIPWLPIEETGKPHPTPPLLPLPFDELIINNLQLMVHTEEETWSIEGDMRVDHSAEGTLLEYQLQSPSLGLSTEGQLQSHDLTHLSAETEITLSHFHGIPALLALPLKTEMEGTLYLRLEGPLLQQQESALSVTINSNSSLKLATPLPPSVKERIQPLQGRNEQAQLTLNSHTEQRPMATFRWNRAAKMVRVNFDLATQAMLQEGPQLSLNTAGTIHYPLANEAETVRFQLNELLLTIPRVVWDGKTVNKLQLDLGAKGHFAPTTNIWQIEINSRDGGLQLPAENLSLERLQTQFTLTADQSGPQLDAQVENLTLRLRPPPASNTNSAAIVPLHYQGSAQFRNDTIQLQGELSGRHRTLPITFNLSHHLSDADGSVTFLLDKATFAEQGLQPQDLFPLFKKQLSAVSGSISADGEYHWGREQRSGATITLDNLSFQTPLIHLEQLSTQLDFSSLTPLQSRGEQQINIGQLDAGVPINDIEAIVRLQADKTLAIKQIQWPFSGGTFSVQDTEFSPDHDPPPFTVTIRDLDLSTLSKMVQLEGLEVNGTLNGAIPIAFIDGKVVIQQAEVKTRQPGLLRFRATAAAAALQQGGESSRLLIQALENFHYQQLRITINGELEGNVVVGIHLSGSNPELYDGYPVELNFNVEGRLVDMVKKEGRSLQPLKRR